MSILATVTDRFGRVWTLPVDEICGECGQPDNCGDCNHEPLTVEQLLIIRGEIA